jgi:hypothetical protein
LDNQLGSIWDDAAGEAPSDLPFPDGESSASPLGHDPLRGPLSSSIPWYRQNAGEAPPHERPRGQFDADLPPTDDYLMCLVGPCRHYREWLEDAETLGERMLTEVRRVCMGFGVARSMDGGTCFGCTNYAPPPWTLAGWRWRVISAHRILRFRRLKAGTLRLSPAERVVEWLYRRVKGTAAEIPLPLPGEDLT